MATVNENADFDPEAAAKKLHRAMRGLGTDEEALIEVLTSHNNAQIQEVKSVYQAMYGKILEEELDSELRGNFQEVLVSLVTPRDIYLARQLKKATKGLGTDESTLTEILMTRTNDEIEHLKEVYEQEHGDSLEEDVRGDTGGAFGCLLLSQLAAARDESHEIDIGLARDDAEEIHEAGEGQWGTDESVFNSILCRRSFNQLRATFSQYQDVTGSSIEGAIESEMSGDLQEGFLALVKSIQDKSAYYAERLYKSMKGLGTDEDTLMRVVISRSEIDMQDIKERFEAAYGDSLAGFIKGDTRGDLEKVLLALIGE